jgi:hypothetical protein
MKETDHIFPYRPEDAAVCPHVGQRGIVFGKAVRYVREHGYPDTETVLDRIAEGSLDDPEAKTAFYISGVPIIEKIIDGLEETKQTHPPYGLLRLDKANYSNHAVIGSVTDFGTTRPFNEFSMAQFDTLTHIASKLAETDHGEPLNSLYDVYHQYELDRKTLTSTNGRIGQITQEGIGTATGTTANILEAIPLVASRYFNQDEVSSELFADIAANSYPLIKDLAIDTSFISIFIIHELQDRMNRITGVIPFDPHSFELNAAGGLQLTQDFKNEFVDRFGRWLGAYPEYTRGCPAAHSPALYNYWNSSVEIARDIWQQELERKRTREESFAAD